MKTVPDPHPWEAACVTRHLGLWLADPGWFMQAVEAVKNGMVPIDAAKAVAERKGDSVIPLYHVDDHGVATVQVAGLMMKGDSKYAKTNTLRTRRAIRTAIADPEVKGMLLHLDSPGGSAAGTAELGQDVQLAASQMPVTAYVDDLAASAAYWAASQATRIVSNENGRVGSIGTVAVVHDSSERAEKQGIKVHVVSTGKFKGAGVPGSEITDEHLAEVQQLVDEHAELFFQGVAQGRRMSLDQVRELADGRTHIAAKALGLGLIDAVGTHDEALAELRNIVATQQDDQGTSRMARADAMIRLTEESCT